jgi:hypothetical protein
VQTQLDGLAERFGSSVTTVDTWTTALARHEAGNERLHQQLQTSLQAFADTFDARATALVTNVGDTHTRIADTVQTQLDGLAERFGSSVATVTDTWTTALTRHEAGNDAPPATATALQPTPTPSTPAPQRCCRASRDPRRLQAELPRPSPPPTATPARSTRLAGSVEAQLDGLAAASAAPWVRRRHLDRRPRRPRAQHRHLTRETRDALAASRGFAARALATSRIPTPRCRASSPPPTPSASPP